jgi:LysM repeat protein
MRRDVGQQVIAGLAILLGVSATLAVGFILAQTDAAGQLGDVTPVSQTGLTPTQTTPTPDIAEDSDNDVTHTPTSAILEATTFPTAQPPPAVTNTPATCDYPVDWQPAVVGQSDTLASLAARYATTTEMLLEGNCLSDPGLQTGQTLYVPPLPEATEERCGPPPGWTTYVVQSGENLFRIGLRYGQSVDSMMQANCLTTDRVDAGQTLFVPPVTPRPSTGTGSSSSSPTDTPNPDETPAPVPGCDNPGAQITSPASGSTLSGDIQFYGTAAAEDFDFYKLEIRPASGGAFTTFTDQAAESPVVNGLLGQVGAYAFTPGKYVIRLAVVDITGTIVAECSINVTLEGG